MRHYRAQLYLEITRTRGRGNASSADGPARLSGFRPRRKKQAGRSSLWDPAREPQMERRARVVRRCTVEQSTFERLDGGSTFPNDLRALCRRRNAFPGASSSAQCFGLRFIHYLKVCEDVANVSPFVSVCQNMLHFGARWRGILLCQTHCPDRSH